MKNREKFEMLKAKYESPVMEVVLFSTEDILTTSGGYTYTFEGEAGDSEGNFVFG